MNRNLVCSFCCLYLLPFAFCFYTSAAELPASSRNLFADNIVIVNKSGHPIIVSLIVSRDKSKDSSFRLADGGYRVLGERHVTTPDYFKKNDAVVTIGHAGEWRGGGEKKAAIIMRGLVEQTGIDLKYKGIPFKDLTLFITIEGPAGYVYSDWTKSYRSEYAPAAKLVGELQLPDDGNPYDIIQEFRAVKAESGGVDERSIERFKGKDKNRWARLVLGLPKSYTQQDLNNANYYIASLYTEDNFPNSAKLIEKIGKILSEAREELRTK
jgi:hypothetical protein